MNEITLKKTYELKETISKDERYLDLIKKEKEMEDDEEVERLSYLKDEANREYNDILRFFDKDSIEAKNAQKKLYEAKLKLESHPKVIAYLKAYSALRNVLDQVNDILFNDFNSSLCKEKEK